jgi:two-component system OmpR family sensor kinase
VRVLLDAPIRLRLTLWYLLLLAVILGVFSVGVWLLMRHTLYQNLEESIKNRAASLLDVIQYDGNSPFLTGLGSSNDQNSDERFVRVFDADGSVTYDGTASVGRVPVDTQAVEAALSGGPRNRRDNVVADGEPMRVRMLPIVRDGVVLGVLEVGQSEDEVSEALTSLLVIIGLAYPVTLAVAGFGGVFLASRALSPIDSVTRAARRVSAEDLRQRLNIKTADDEVGRLARTFNEMINRLEIAFKQQRQFTTDASHELRTPLTVIKGQIDVALQNEREPEAYRLVLRTINEEVDRLIRLAGSLLTLTRADSGQIPLTLEKVELWELATLVLDQMEPLATNKGVQLSLEPGPRAVLKADEDLLLQLMLNLLDNAIKYTPQGGRVVTGWGVRDDLVEVWVQDTGIGISPEHLPYLFDRFYRVDKARAPSEGGSGLGLAISNWIAKAHGGSISVESIPGQGSRFTVLLPV